MSTSNARGGLLRAVVNYGLGSYVPQLVNFLLLPVYTHFMPPAEQGALEICVTAQTLLVIGMRLGLPGSVTRFYYDHKETPALKDQVTTVALAVVASSALMTTVAMLLGPLLFARWFPDVPFHPLMDLALTSAFFQAAPDLQRRLIEARQRSGFAAKLAAAFALTNTAITMTLLVGFHMGARGVLTSSLVTGVLFAVVAWWNHRSDLRGHFQMKLLIDSLHYGLPLVPHHAGAWAQQFVGRWVLGAVTTAAAVGHLGVAARVASPLMIVTGAFATGYSPLYFGWRSDLSKSEALLAARRVLRVLMSLGGIAVVGAATLGGSVVRHVLAPSYADAAPLVGLLAAAAFGHLIYSAVAAEIFYSKATARISVTFLTASAVNLTVVWLFARQYGAVAAALAQLAGAVVSLALSCGMAVSTFPLPLEPRSLVASVVVAGTSCVLAPRLASSNAAIDVLQNAFACVVLGLALVTVAGTHRELGHDLRSLVGRRLRRARTSA